VNYQVFVHVRNVIRGINCAWGSSNGSRQQKILLGECSVQILKHTKIGMKDMNEMLQGKKETIQLISVHLT
jgi:hypothetical protein